MHGVPRFVLQAGLLIAAAGIAATVHLGPFAIVVVMAAAFTVVVLGEWLATRGRVERTAGAAPGQISAPAHRPERRPPRPGRPSARAAPAPDTAPVTQRPRPRATPIAQPHRPAPVRRSLAAPPPAPEVARPPAAPAPALEVARPPLVSRPARGVVRPAVPAPTPEPVPAPPAAAAPAPEPEPEPEPAAPVLPVPAPVVELRRWNVFQLEKRAREVAARDPLRGEELFALLLHLRVFGDSGGELAEDFDGFVREALAELL
jgi:hypothetical protein